ncbi:hypothetical protein EV426DRAFT_704968 [Tirmania nivea]|nr:hypothetical protein EV426DRAFT_704968 [Tirmania nivea]
MPPDHHEMSTIAVSRIIGFSVIGALCLLGCILLFYYMYIKPNSTQASENQVQGTNVAGWEPGKAHKSCETEDERLERAYEKWERRWGNPQEDYCRGQKMEV